MDCEKIVDVKCPKGHVRKQKCYQFKPSKCRLCDTEDDRDNKVLERDMEVQDKRLRAQVKHDMDVADVETQIRKIREEIEDKKMAGERARALGQKRRDLEAAQHQAKHLLQQESQDAPQATRPVSSSRASADDSKDIASQQPDTRNEVNSTDATRSASSPTAPKKSPSELEWERQKRIEGSANAAMDDLMALTGLEDVKAKMLGIKAKVETLSRQGIDMKKERMGMVMLGNPGTGRIHWSAGLSF